jgi:hypothetical protein
MMMHLCGEAVSVKIGDRIFPAWIDLFLASLTANPQLQNVCHIHGDVISHSFA